jgi:hypothetical protein
MSQRTKEGDFMANAQVNQHHRNTRIIAVLALVVAVIGLGVAFAVLSTTLNIQGSAQIKKADWLVKWGNLSCSTTSGEATVDSSSITTATTTDDTVNVAASFLSSGDTVTCTMNALNTGSIDAKLQALPTANTSAVNAKDVTTTLTYGDGSTPAVDDALAATSGSQAWKLVLTYTGDPVAQDDASPTSFSYTIPYVQAAD